MNSESNESDPPVTRTTEMRLGTEPPGGAALMQVARSQDTAIDALWTRGDSPRFLLLLAHGAGAGMRHPHLERLALQLAEVGVDTLRYQFPYMQAGGRRPDRPPVLEQTVRRAAQAARELSDLPLLAGGRSMGGRMTLRAQAREQLPGVLGLVLFSFPLHRALRLNDPDPERLERASHLSRVDVPFLLLQGTRDALARTHLVHRALTAAPVQLRKVHWVEGADHSFRTLKSLGRSLEDTEAELAEAVARWSALLPLLQ